MEKKWLFDVIKDGILRDNREYFIKNKVFSVNDNSFFLHVKKYRGRRSIINDNDGVWQFLNTTANTFKNEPLKLFTFNSHEYEHNTDDDLLEISGLNWANGYIKTGNVVGSLKQGGYELKITSRFGDNFLKYIISDADGFLELKDYGGTSNKNAIHWLLVFLWKVKLKKAFRLGLPKEYVTKSERLIKTRGLINTLDFYKNRKIGKYECTYREHSYLSDAAILINEVLHSEQAKDFVQDINPIKQAFRVASYGKRLSNRELKKIKQFKNPFYSDYNEVIALSKKILFGQGLDIDKQQDTSAFLFDVSMLFEYFIKKLLIRNGIRVLSKFGEAVSIKTGVGNRPLQPDLIIEESDGLSIFDVKYKHFNNNDGVKREDLFQLHTYVGQYGNNAKINSCGFIFPSKIKRKPLISEIEVMGIKTTFKIFFLEIPLDDSQNFAEEFNANCRELILSFKDNEAKLHVNDENLSTS